MYKNQLQELAQRSCFNLPSYSCIREGPDHAPRFKAAVNFNGDVFESPSFCNTLRQAEHSAAEVALQSLSSRAPSHSLAAKILDETGVYKNLLQEISQRVGARLPTYTTFRSGLGHLPVFTCTVELAGITFTGEPAKNKKQAEKNAAMAAWSSLKKLAKQESSSSSLSETTVAESNDEQEQITIARALLRYRLKEKMVMAINPDVAAGSPFLKKFLLQPDKKPSSVHSTSSTGSKILPLIRQQSAPRTRPASYPATPIKFPGAGAGAVPYMPIRQYRPQLFNHCNAAPAVTMRTAVPVFASPPSQYQPTSTPPLVCIASPVQIRQAVPVFGARPFTIQVKQPPAPPTKQEVSIPPPPPTKQEAPIPPAQPTKQETVVPPTEQALPNAAIPAPVAEQATQQLSPPPPTPTEAETPEIISESTETGGDDGDLPKSAVTNNLENLMI